MPTSISVAIVVCASLVVRLRSVNNNHLGSGHLQTRLKLDI
jgi:hypothetical protein